MIVRRKSRCIVWQSYDSENVLLSIEDLNFTDLQTLLRNVVGASLRLAVVKQRTFGFDVAPQLNPLLSTWIEGLVLNVYKATAKEDEICEVGLVVD